MKWLKGNSIEVKKSKFKGFYYELDSVDEVEDILEDLRNSFKNARHIPYAYKFGNQIKKSDDKEPSNTAGLPIYNCIERNNLDHVLIAIVRIYGGVKLGSGPLFRTYSRCVNELVNDFLNSHK